MLHTMLNRIITSLSASSLSLAKCCALELLSIFKRPPSPPRIQAGPIPVLEEHTEDGRDDMGPEDEEVTPPRQLFGLRIQVVVVAHVQELLWIIRDDPVHLVPDAPSHHVHFVHGPYVDGPIGGSGVPKEGLTGAPDENLLKKVEGDIGDFEQLAGGREVESDPSDGKARQILIAQREILDLRERQILPLSYPKLHRSTRTAQQPSTIR